jgi:hypothetical protein
MTADRPDRFFPTTLLGDFLHVRSIPDWGPWHAGSIEYTRSTGRSRRLCSHRIR